MNILVIGDIVGDSGVNMAINHVRRLKKEYEADFCIINGENACSNNGITKEKVQILFDCGADVLTLGNHTFRQKEIISVLEENSSVIRPINYPQGTPGSGFTVKTVKGKRIAVINALGRIYMDYFDCPFQAIDKLLESLEADIIMVDFHAEATSEKQALAWHLDGRISALFGTHTHVQTADARILLSGTGYITDIGMTGPYNSCLGVRRDIIIDRFMKCIPQRFEFANGPAQLCGAVFKINDDNKTESVTAINIRP